MRILEGVSSGLGQCHEGPSLFSSCLNFLGMWPRATWFQDGCRIVRAHLRVIQAGRRRRRSRGDWGQFLYQESKSCYLKLSAYVSLARLCYVATSVLRDSEGEVLAGHIAVPKGISVLLGRPGDVWWVSSQQCLYQKVTSSLWSSVIPPVLTPPHYERSTQLASGWAPCGDPQGHGHTHSTGPRQHTGHSPWLSLLPCRPAGTSLFRMYQDSGDPLSCCHFRIGRPWLPTLGSPPRVESWSLCPRLSRFYSSLYYLTPMLPLLPLLHLTSKPPTRDNVWVGQSPSVRNLKSGRLTATPVVTSRPSAPEHVVASLLSRDLRRWRVLMDPRSSLVPYLRSQVHSSAQLQQAGGSASVMKPVWVVL